MTRSIAIRDKKIIEEIKAEYRRRGRINELLLFSLAINTGINISNLIELKVKDVRNKQELSFRKSKDKTYLISLCLETIELINTVTEGKKLADNVFESSKGNVLNRSTVLKTFKDICKKLDLLEEYSASSWRKTFAYHYWLKNNDLLYLLGFFEQQLRCVIKYIGIEDELDLTYAESTGL